MSLSIVCLPPFPFKIADCVEQFPFVASFRIPVHELTENPSEPCTNVLWDFALNNLDELRSILLRILDGGTVFVLNGKPDKEAPGFPQAGYHPGNAAGRLRGELAAYHS